MQQTIDLIKQLRSNPGKEQRLAEEFLRDLNRSYSTVASAAVKAIQDFQRGDTASGLEVLQKAAGLGRTTKSAQPAGPIEKSIRRSLGLSAAEAEADAKAAEELIAKNEAAELARCTSHQAEAAVRAKFARERQEAATTFVKAVLGPRNAKITPAGSSEYR